MYLLLIGLIVLAALLMCFVVLIQNSKGGGLASSFASSNQIMGVRKTTDFIEKLTWGLAAFMVACSVLTAYFVPAAHTDSSVIMKEAAKMLEFELAATLRDQIIELRGETQKKK